MRNKIIITALLGSLAFGTLIGLTPRFPDIDHAQVISYSGNVDRAMYESVVSQTKDIKKGSTIVFKLKTHGGYIAYKEKIMEHLHSVSKNVVVQVEDYAISAGAMMVAEADHAIVSRNAIILIHTPRVNSMGDMLIVSPTFNYEYNKILLKNPVFSTVLRGDLLAKYLAGKDIVLTGITFAAKVNNPAFIKVIHDDLTVKQHIDHVFKDPQPNLID